MANFKEITDSLKDGLKAFLKSEMKKEEIDEIAKLTKLVDSAVEENGKTVAEYNALKDDYIKAIRNTGIHSDSNPNDKDTGRDNKEVSFDECLEKAQKKDNKE